MIALEKMDVGSPPAGFEFTRTGQGGPAQWVVVSDPTASGGRAVEQSSTERTDYRFPLAIYRPLLVKNGDVAVRFKSVAGKVDQAGGIAMRLIDAGNYYVVRANALEDNVRFYRMVKGKREQLAGADVKVSGNEWHTRDLRPKASALPSRSTATSCSRRPTEPSRTPAKSHFGPRLTASPASIASRSRHCSDLKT